MKLPRRLLIAAIVLGLAGFVGWRSWRAAHSGEGALTGYIEGETLYLSAPTAGPVAQVFVRRGDQVTAGQPLFAMDGDIAAAQQARSAAGAQVAAAQARDARKGLRPAELGVTEARIAAARARERGARLELDRASTLASRGFLAKAALDQARANHDAAEAEVRALQSEWAAETLGARADAIAAADARRAEADAGLSESERRAAQLAPRAPAAGRVEDVFFQPGEWAAANQPIVALMPQGRVRIRFFVPETAVSAYAPGKVVRFSCDSCASGLSAVINYVSPRPEFTPPVIYSRESRERLVFMVEAQPASAAGLVPGLPVDVVPLSAGKARP